MNNFKHIQRCRACMKRCRAEAPILRPPDAKNWFIGKDPDAGKDWRQEKGTTEDEMVGWHHWLDGHEFEQALRVGDGQGSLLCCSPWGHKESDTTEQLNWTESMNDTMTPVRHCPASTSTIFKFFFLIHFIFWPQGMWDLSSLIRDWTCAPCSGSTES